MASHLISLSAGGHFIEPPASEVQGAWKAGAQLLRNRDGSLSPGRFLLSVREFVAHTATVKYYQTSHQTNSKCRLAKNRDLSSFFRATSLSSFLYIYIYILSLPSSIYLYIYMQDRLLEQVKNVTRQHPQAQQRGRASATCASRRVATRSNTNQGQKGPWQQEGGNRN
jgi:hypothetical protein